jgi:hypothetical protein
VAESLPAPQQTVSPGWVVTFSEHPCTKKQGAHVIVSMHAGRQGEKKHCASTAGSFQESCTSKEMEGSRGDRWKKSQAQGPSHACTTCDGREDAGSRAARGRLSTTEHVHCRLMPNSWKWPCADVQWKWPCARRLRQRRGSGRPDGEAAPFWPNGAVNMVLAPRDSA